MLARRFFSVVPALFLVAACGGETTPAESPEGADQDAMAEETDMAEEGMGDEMGGEEGMGDEMGGEEGMGEEEAVDEAGEEEVME